MNKKTVTLEKAIEQYDQFVNVCKYFNLTDSQEEFEQLAAWLRELAERRKQPEIIYCKDCRYYSNGECDSNEMWQNLYGETTEVESISRYPNDFCSYAERRTDD